MTSGAVDPIIEVQGVVRAFGDVRALDGVDLIVEPGIVYALLGPNGAGKTTLIRVLATLLRPDRGSVRVAGVDVVADPNAARARIGLAGQFAAVDAFLTGRENVEMVGRLYGLSAREARRRADDVLERIGLTRDAGRQVGTYSGGMRRRLDLAASLVGRPEVMFLDEPTTGIDPRTRLELWDLIEDLVAAGTSVLLTTQYLDEADRLAARIGVIDRGVVVQEGTADELKDAVGGSVLELVVHDEDRVTAVETISSATGEEVAELGGRRLRVAAREGSRTLLEVVRALDAAGVEADDIGLHRPSLDDVFLAVTGEPAGSDLEADRELADPAAATAGSGGRGRGRRR
ncbi:MAG: ATP-binding cassette domain-containing protein [Nitriliruptor sp.]|nr:MAG: ATP-binding cassette domain-containing protein [Nitriliruptor sp.]